MPTTKANLKEFSATNKKQNKGGAQAVTKVNLDMDNTTSRIKSTLDIALRLQNLKRTTVPTHQIQSPPPRSNRPNVDGLSTIMEEKGLSIN